MARATVSARVRVRVCLDEIIEMRFIAGVFPHINLAFTPIGFISTRQNSRCHVQKKKLKIGFLIGIDFNRQLISREGEEMAGAAHGLA